MRNIHYINAGAGSGKTYSLTKTLVNLIKENECKPSEVILTTFTELAATEFRQKAYDALVKEKCYDKAAELDSAAIGTVHSIALRYVQKYWYILGLGCKMNVLSEDDKKVFISEAVAKVIEPEDRLVFMKFNETFTRKGYRTDDPWIEVLKSVLEKADTFGIEDLESSRRHSLDFVATFFRHNQAKLNIEKAKQWLKSYRQVVLNGKRNGEQYSDVDKILEKIDSCAENPCSYHGLICLKSILTDLKNPSVSEALPDYDYLLENVEEATQSSDFMPPLLDCITTVFDLAIKVQRAFEKYKADNGFIEYNDMERYFIQLLDNDLVKEDIRGSVKYVFVDEFQDSNPIQIEIFSKLSELVVKSFWVGDPKQSIYGFRGSAPEIVMDITRNILKGGKGFSYESLPYSWRSGKKLVEFDTAVALSLFKDPQRYPDPGLKAAPNGNSFNAEHPVQHWNIFGKKNASIAERIINLLSTTDLKPKDIALLCKTNENVSIVADDLRSFGLPVSAPEVFLSQKAETKLLFAVLKYMINKDPHTKAELAMLMTGATLAEIVLEKDRVLSEFDEKGLMQIADRVRHQSIPDIVDTIIDELDLRGLCSRWGDASNRQANLDTLQRLSREYDSHCVQMGIGSSLGGFINYVDSQEIPPKGSNSDNGIKVLTYHASKGLEWRMVIMLDLQKNMTADNILKPRFLYGINIDSDGKGRQLLRFIPDFRPSERHGVPDFIMDQSRISNEYRKYVERCRDEAKRLLYVGFTRARDILVTVSISAKRGQFQWLSSCGLNPHDPGLITTEGSFRVWGNGIPESKVYALYSSDPQRFAARAEQIIWYAPKVQLSKRPDRYVSPSMLRGALESTSLPPEHICPGIEVIGPYEASTLGTCVHNFFAICDYENVDLYAAAKRIVHNFGLNETIPDTTEMVRSYQSLSRHLTVAYGHPVRIHHELPFINSREDGRTVVGEIDLVWEMQNRHCVIVDYKNEQHHSNHSAQMAAYKEALENAGYVVDAVLIYFPLDGDLMEIVSLQTL